MPQISPFEAFAQIDTGTHGGRIVQLLATAGGRTLVSAGETTVRVWDVEQRRLQRLLLGRVNGATDDSARDGRAARIAASPDGRWLVVLKPWRHRPAAERPAPATAAPPPAFGYGADVARAVEADRATDRDAGHDAGRVTEVQVFELATGNLRSRWIHPGQLLDLDFSPDGRRLALVANRRVGRLRQVEVLLLAARDLLRPGARGAPEALSRLDLGRPRGATTLPAGLRFVPPNRYAARGDTTLVVAMGEPRAERGHLAWLGCTADDTLVVQRAVEVDSAIGTDTLSVSDSVAALGAEPPRGRGERGRLLWFRHDGSEAGAVGTEAPPASTAFSPSGERLAVGLMVDLEGSQDAPPGMQTVQVNAYDVPALGAPLLRSSYFGHDDSVRALTFVAEERIASAGGDNRAIHFWDPAHRIAELQGAIRGVGRAVVAPGITADERVLFGTVPRRLLPPGHAVRQQSFDLRRMVLTTTAPSRVRRTDFASRKWFVGDFDDVVIPLWYIGDLRGPRPTAAPDREPDLNLFVGADDEWVAWTRSGYYDAGGLHAARRIAYRVNRGVGQEALLVPSDRFKAFYRPDIVRAVVRHGTEARARDQGVDVAPVDVAQVLPPIVDLTPQGIRRQGDRVGFAFTVEAPCPEYLPTRISLLRNDRVVWALRDPPQRPRSRCEVPMLPLLPGPNRFSLQAENSQSKSVPVQFEIAGPAPADDGGPPGAVAPGRLFLLSVGVAEFADPRNRPLRFPQRDAQAVFDAIGHGRLASARPGQRRSRNRAFDSVDARLLLDAKATKAAILAELGRMSEAIRSRHGKSGTERDVLFVFLSGHGIRVFEGGVPSLFFMNHDLVPTAEDVDATGLSILDLGELITSVPAEVVLVIDACHASLAGSGVVAGLEAEELARRVHAIYERGMYLVSAARADELAREDRSSRFGVLTAALLQTLEESLPRLRRTRGRRGQEVLMAELVAGIQRLVPVVSARAGSAPQTPVCRIYGDLTPLTILKI